MKFIVIADTARLDENSLSIVRVLFTLGALKKIAQRPARFFNLVLKSRYRGSIIGNHLTIVRFSDAM